MKDWQILLYYYYTSIENTSEYKRKHKDFCNKRNFRGRVIISNEGLNGTLSGPKKQCLEYINFVKSDNRFSNIEFKIDECNGHVFPKMSIKIRNNLININRDDLNPNIKTGKHLSSLEFKKKWTMIIQ